MVSAKDAAEYAQSLTGVRRLVERDLDAFFAGLDLTRPERARDELLEFMPILVAQYGEVAGAVAADWYETVRFEEVRRGTFRATTQPSRYQSVVPEATRRVAGELFTDNPGNALVGLRAFAGKYALDGGRETIIRNSFRDPQSGGWSRVAVGKTCSFCLALVSRGFVYRYESVGFASHAACDCAAIPSFDKSAPEVPPDAYVASRRRSQMTPEQRRIHTERTSAWVSEFEWRSM